ncbi:pyruvate:ferredoxin (flavodoxin) oxidoreductase [candidate division KSB1 bacterium]
MSENKTIMMDGNEAAAYVAHRTNEIIAIYPITPSSDMGEHSDAWSAQGRKNIWGTIPQVTEMQSEGGAAGAVHGALQTGALTTTFTASQGLLLMIPSMFKIAGELTSTVFHVSARSLACQALSIFGDHSDVMSTRSTGFGLISSNSPQEVLDFALIAQAAALKSRIPFIHFFDGFRTSHEVNKVELISDEDMKKMIDYDLVLAHRERSMNPDSPILRGTSQNPDVYFQARETVNPYYIKCPEIVQEMMDRFADLTGRKYSLFEYVGHPEAEKLIIMMGSGGNVAHDTVDYLNAQGEKVGLIKVRLFRPFQKEALLKAIPDSVKIIGVLDRTKEPGGLGEPLFMDVLSTVALSGRNIKVVGGRYGLSSKEFTPAMVKGVYDEISKKNPRQIFTVGINDDVTNLSVDFDPDFNIEKDDVIRAVFYGLGADGTVGANKNSIKIIGEYTPNFAQGYFVYDSKKAGAITVSHLRFGPDPIKLSCLIDSANFIACHQSVFLEKIDVLEKAKEGATFLLNCHHGPDEVWDHLPRSIQETIINKNLKFFVIDGYKVAKETGMGVRTNTIMQTCFFAISGVLPKDEAIAAIKDTIYKTYGKKGDEIVNKNYNAVDQALSNLFEVKVPDKITSTFDRPPVVDPKAPEFVQEVTAPIMAGNGDLLPVSKFPDDGTYPLSTTKWEKRCIAQEIPVVDEDICIQCGKCVLICPHAAIRAKVFKPEIVEKAPETFKTMKARGKEFADQLYSLQVAPEDCTGCGLCVHFCPVKNKKEPKFKAVNMHPLEPIRAKERENYEFFLDLPDYDRSKLRVDAVKDVQFLEPLFEYSGACAGCGETPYYKLLTQLFGDRAIICNATGCSSIYGGNLPTTPFTTNKDGQGPAWSNSLFEDNAEFGFGFRLSNDKQAEFARELAVRLKDNIGPELVDSIVNANQKTESDIAEQRERVKILKKKIKGLKTDEAKQLMGVANSLVKRSIWIVGGDGWAYDIGYGGLDHVLASGRNVNILVLDTEVYSNTGGQMSKSTPIGAVAKFAAGGKPISKKDLGMMAMNYGNVYVAQVAMGANDAQTVRAFREAEAYDGPSIIIAYSHCIAHGINMETGTDQHKYAVNSGHWILYRYNPDNVLEDKNPLLIDSKAPSISMKDYMYSETRFKMLTKFKPERAEELLSMAQDVTKKRRMFYEHLASMKMTNDEAEDK